MKKGNSINIIIGGIIAFWIIFTLSIIAGISMKTTGSTSNNVKKVEVLEVDNDVIKIKLGEINGDPIIREMKKPLFSNYKEGDRILVKEDNNKISRSMDPDKVAKIGESLIFIPILVLLSIVIITFAIILPFIYIKEGKNKIRNSIQVACFSPGFIMMFLFGDSEELNHLSLIGFGLISVSFLIGIIWKEKR